VDRIGFAAHGEVLGAVVALDRCPPAMKASFNTQVFYAVSTERITARGIVRRAVVGILPPLRTDMLRKLAERLNKALRGDVLVLEWRTSGAAAVGPFAGPDES